MPATLLMNARLDGTDVLTDVHVVDGHIRAVGSIELPIRALERDRSRTGTCCCRRRSSRTPTSTRRSWPSASPTRPATCSGAIEAMAANRHLTTVADIAERAERAARLMASNGYVAVRTHVDVTLENGLRSVEALAAVRERARRSDLDRDRRALRLARHRQPVARSSGRCSREAMAAGADLVGGCPHLDDDIGGGASTFFLGVATDLGVGVDLHTDETLDPAVDGLGDLCRAVLAGFDRGPSRPATA